MRMTSSLALRYARSFVSYLEAGKTSEKRTEAILDELRKLIPLFREIPGILLTREEAAEHVVKELKRLETGKELLVLFLILRGEKRVSLFPEVLVPLQEMLYDELGIRHFKVTWARAPDAGARKSLEAVLAAAGKLVLEEDEDPDLIAGFVIQEKDRIWDRSWRRHMTELEARMHSLTEGELVWKEK